MVGEALLLDAFADQPHQQRDVLAVPVALDLAVAQHPECRRTYLLTRR